MHNNVMNLIKLAQKSRYEVCIWGAGNVGTHSGLHMLKKRGIEVDYYCDSNPKLWGLEIVDGIKCRNVEEIRGRDVICFILVSSHLLEEVCNQAVGLGIKNIVTYDDLCELELGTYFQCRNRKKIAVYTCVIGGYDEVKEPISISEECDYFLISDEKPRKDTIFQYINSNDCIPAYINDSTRKNRYCKINAHKIFPQYRYSIYADGCMRLKSNIIDKIYELPKTRIMTFSENSLGCLYMEAMRAAEHGRDVKETIIKQVEKYWLEGMPENFGSVACGVLIREHNNPVCRKIMEEWWEQIELFSKRDQISFPYVLWKNGYTMSDVGILYGHGAISDEYLIWEREHSRPRGI